MTEKPWQIWIDTGGTFTDCFAKDTEGNVATLKVLSTSSLRCSISFISSNTWQTDQNWGLSKNILTGYPVRILSTGRMLKIRDFNPDTKEISFDPPFQGKEGYAQEIAIHSEEEVPVFAARILTQTSMGEELPPIEMRLGSTRGTNALLERKGANTALLITSGFKDLLRIGTQQREDLFALNVAKPEPYFSDVHEVNERIDAEGNVLEDVDQDQVKKISRDLKNAKIESIAVAFLNSYKNPVHEKLLASLLKAEGFEHISISSSLFNAIKILPRAETSVANAYLSPVIKNYITNIEKSIFTGHEGDLKIMTSAGGLIASGTFNPKDSLLSGPAGGLVGASVAAAKSGINKVLTLDMGGTSTDVARYDHGFDYRYETRVGNARILSPALFIETIAAGGGSICSFDGFRFTVGPESAGADPGPACYGDGGPLTITDINLLLGKIDPRNFGIPVHIEASEKALVELQKQLAKDHNKDYTREEILTGFEQIADEKMAEAIKKISVSKGYDPKEYTLLAFGGAGGQHACRVADILDIGKILIPRDAGLLSAFGIGNAYIERFAEKQILKPLEEVSDGIDSILTDLEAKVLEELKNEGFSIENIHIRDRFFYLRFAGQENTLEVKNKTRLLQVFREKYEALYGHWIENRKVELESIKVVGSDIKESPGDTSGKVKNHKPNTSKSVICWLLNDWITIPSFDRSSLKSGAIIKGAAVIGSNTSTTFINPGWQCEIDHAGNCIMTKVEDSAEAEIAGQKPVEAELALFSNRFTAIAEEMGAMFQRTSFSVNIKERLDFSCAILDAEGYLVVNAPHIPVHLGSMGICVRKLRESMDMEEGDVIITNHPGFGGSHLPDITLVSPVFHKGKLAGYVANRGHHAEVGGLLPGSTPPGAKNLQEEGVVIEPTYLVRKGITQLDTIRRIFLDAPYPTRAIEENMADLNGALASIRLGLDQMSAMIRNFGFATVRKFMSRIREHAHQALLAALTPSKEGKMTAEEHLDNGAVLKVTITIQHPGVVFDFSGTSKEQRNNFNATPAITTSAVLYVLRLIAAKEIPLNEGLMKSVEIVLPQNLLNPDFNRPTHKCPPVVGGNTETSQRLVDTLIKALGLAGCSQGTMNNLLFGDDTFGYYETIGGGTGAGNGFDGTDAVHHHMTNTRITDPEIMELRYPVRVKEFSIRQNSGGSGKWKGGNGITRKLTFTGPVELTILSQHRKYAPFGMNGGLPGKKGTQWIEHPDGRILKLKGHESYSAQAGDTIVINTPGGGGFGKK